MCTKPIESTTESKVSLEKLELPKLKQALRPRLESEETLSDDEQMVIDEEGDDDVIGKFGKNNLEKKIFYRFWYHHKTNVLYNNHIIVRLK